MDRVNRVAQVTTVLLSVGTVGLSVPEKRDVIRTLLT